jgi:hypothetical protein
MVEEPLMAELKINGEVIDATEFAYDGCHKIYLVRTPKERAELIECGYYRTVLSELEGGFLLPISELPKVWDETCPLRFISSGDLTKQFVPQCEDASVEYD